jgi:hypothetical protein
VFRPSTATFWIQQSTNNQTISQAFGQSNDKPVVGDYDGDGRFDVATWRSDNVWRILNSSSGQTTNVIFGLFSTDQTVQGDYDADGKTDIAVYRDGLPPPQNQQSYWYILKSSDGQTRTEAFGIYQDIPVPAPYRR